MRVDNGSYEPRVFKEVPKVWCFTFYDNCELSKRYVKLKGTFISTRDKMLGLYGDVLNLQYSLAEFNLLDLETNRTQLIFGDNE
jgi:hypothetical protein